MNKVQNVSVVGLGKLGGTMAACFASRGLNVVGVDISRKAVDALNAGRTPVQETGLDELVAANSQRLRATMSHEEAMADAEISFVIVPTPSDSTGAFSLQYATYAFAEMGRALKVKKDYHVIVLTSTVLPGSLRHGLLPVLERESGKKCGPDFGLCYNPEFIALGSIIKDFLNPDFYLVGEFDARSGDRLAAVHDIVSENRAPIKRMSIENAELAKIAINSYVTMKISYANIMAEFCERIPGGDVDVISDALGMDSRIGRKYLTGGFGFGGPCFPRDNVALNYLGEQLGVACPLLKTNDDFNRTISDRLIKKLRSRLKPQSTVAVLGLAYKPKSHVIEESPGIYLCKALSDSGLRVVGHDPLAGPSAELALKYSALVQESLSECLRVASTVLIATRDEAYVSLTPEELLGGKERVQVVDFWRCMSPEVANHPRIDYVPIGRCIEDDKCTDELHGLWADPEKKD